jgi:hypothetical protein
LCIIVRAVRKHFHTKDGISAEKKNEWCDPENIEKNNKVLLWHTKDCDFCFFFFTYIFLHVSYKEKKTCSIWHLGRFFKNFLCPYPAFLSQHPTGTKKWAFFGSWTKPS